jgi:hypothetical protein
VTSSSHESSLSDSLFRPSSSYRSAANSGSILLDVREQPERLVVDGRRPQVDHNRGGRGAGLLPARAASQCHLQIVFVPFGNRICVSPVTRWPGSRGHRPC